ncbi:APA family basic amino acid/polyamine antiporter [Aulographum hederae CBS 113979]|uniref:APA family basic amino acid/polyamine antiporter n=1 Tax=Aulographum hederae CBS 113979 TaxID=1176131 RepID=A0A6G1GMC1_9PEZI|nr:APA family basic amino acid/polyamine antiporter [Aulographum hederae CBS 113979]
MATHGEPSAVDVKDEARLAQLGYKQELKRDWSVLHNFGVSFSIISVVTGITTLFRSVFALLDFQHHVYGLNTGGPGVMTVGWIVVSFFTFFVGLSMAEIVSAIPTSGGPYFWAAMLAPQKHAAIFSWFCGWFNFVGQFAVTTGITFGCANLISTLVSVKNASYEGTPGMIIGIHAALLVSHGLTNTFGVHILRYLNNSSIILHSLGCSALAIAVVSAAPTHRSAKEVFATFYDGTGVDGAPGWSERASPAYVAITGILLSQYTITGFDASAHLSEETRNASWSAPIGVLTSIGVSAVFGFFLLVCLLFSIQNFETTVASDYSQPVLQILVDIFGEDGAIALFTLIIICVWHCGLFSMTSNSRMMFAFSRDGALPKFFDHVDMRFQSPIRAVWLAAFLAFLLSLPSLGSAVAFSAATSIATIGLYISYVIPVVAALIWPQNFVKGPFDLGKFSRPVGIISILWVTFITIVFCLPSLNPVDSQTLNYTPVAVGIVIFFTSVSWFFWAHKWFTGPIRQIEAEQAGVSIAPGEYERAEEEGIVNDVVCGKI